MQVIYKPKNIEICQQDFGLRQTGENRLMK